MPLIAILHVTYFYIVCFLFLYHNTLLYVSYFYDTILIIEYDSLHKILFNLIWHIVHTEQTVCACTFLALVMFWNW